MNLATAQLQEIEAMAELFMPLRFIALNIEVDPDEFEIAIKSETGDVYKAYITGRLKAKTELHKSIKLSALSGSTPAQQLMMQFYNNE